MLTQLTSLRIKDVLTAQDSHLPLIQLAGLTNLKMFNHPLKRVTVEYYTMWPNLEEIQFENTVVDSDNLFDLTALTRIHSLTCNVSDFASVVINPNHLTSLKITQSQSLKINLNKFTLVVIRSQHGSCTRFIICNVGTINSSN